MNIISIDPVHRCYWCGAQVTKTFRAEDAQKHVYFCACGIAHAQLYVEDMQQIYQDLENKQRLTPKSWRMRVIHRDFQEGDV